MGRAASALQTASSKPAGGRRVRGGAAEPSFDMFFFQALRAARLIASDYEAGYIPCC
jgi:hypothetical protein